MNKGRNEMYTHIGIDVSKEKVDLGWVRDAAKNKVKSKVFANKVKDFEAVASWITKNAGVSPDEVLITLEPTGVYHQHLADYLGDQGFNIFLVNAGLAKKYAQAVGIVHKTDKSDALMLAYYGLAKEREGSVELWHPAPQEARHLDILLRRLDALEKDLQREENRFEASSHGISTPLVIESIEKMIQVLKDEIARLTSDIDDHIDRHPELKEKRERMTTIDGVGPVVSREMTSLFANHVFKNAKQVSAYLGLIPKIKESGNWKGHTSLSKTGPSRLRAKLYMAAVVASTYNSDIKAQRDRLLANGKNKMQALGAAMRKLVQICFGVVKHQQSYLPQTA